MDKEEIARRVAEFPRWHYEFDLKGVKTPIYNERFLNRHVQRKAYFFDALVSLCGGSLKGKRILDIGCNAGFWPLQSIEAGADFVQGIEGRQFHVDQAELVFEALEVSKDRYDFHCANLYDVDFADFGEFDIVCYLGLMYHISKPIELMEKINKVNSDLVVIDTQVIPSEESMFKVVHENLEDPRNSSENSLVLRPSALAVIDHMKMFDYDVVAMTPDFSDYSGVRAYKIGNRQAFIGSKQTSLEPLREREREIAARDG